MIKNLKIQKILVWIPLVNFLTFFMYAINMFSFLREFGVWKSTKYVAPTMIAMLICLGIEIELFGLINSNLIGWIVFVQYYIEGLTIGHICIFSQKSMIKK